MPLKPSSLALAFFLAGTLLPAPSSIGAPAKSAAAPADSGPRTYYVRTDGGDATQCSGLVDAPLHGNERSRACAWKHPFVALPPTRIEAPVAARLHGGDTLVIAAGSYMMGYGAPDTGVCTPEAAYDCIMQSVPAGPSAQQPTRVLGAGWDSGCKTPPELWGTQRAYGVLQLRGTANVDVACLELTDHSSCIENHCSWEGRCGGEVDRCKRDGYPFGTWAENGLVAENASRVTLSDLNIHGLGNEGVRAGRLSDWTVHRTRIWANGFGGWDGDLGKDSGNSGTMRFDHVEIAWNGCGERYPGGEVFGCWGQEEGGYGDGLGTGDGGGSWLFEDMHVHDNMQDGLDLLHLRGDSAVTMRRVRAEGNLGNQLKATGDTLIENSTIDGSCAAHAGKFNLRHDDNCRANGDSINIGLVDGKRAEVRGNDIRGQGGCLITGANGGKDAVLSVRDNVLTGGPRWLEPGKITCGIYLHESKGRVEESGNRTSNVEKSAEGSAQTCRKWEAGVHDSESVCALLERAARSAKAWTQEHL